MGVLEPWNRVLVVAAVGAEARAAWLGLAAGRAPPEFPAWEPVPAGTRFEIVVSGVGKALAAGCVARHVDVARHAAVLNIGVCGSLPGSGLDVGDVIVATASAYADEGLDAETGFVDLARMSPRLKIEGGPFPTDPRLAAGLSSLGAGMGVIATVSTCAGTDARADEVVRRTGARAEAMEGAAAAQVAQRLGIPFAEVRAVSNTTGNRSSQRWDLPAAFARFTALIGRM